jgi:exodeoxyribonuclease V alpha subunit
MRVRSSTKTNIAKPETSKDQRLTVDNVFDASEDFLPTNNGNAEDAFLPLDYSVRGEIMRVVYSNPDNHYSVLRLRDDDDKELTLVGMLPGVLEGQRIEAQGRWERHKEHGRQFHVNSFNAILPSSAEGIRRYLASGVLPGIGEVYAERIVEHFGTDTLDVLDKASERLKEVPGIGKKRIADIRRAWRESNSLRSTLVFLQGLGLSPALCGRIVALYGDGVAAEVVQRNPYRLAYELDGVGFLSADRIAMRMGIAADSPLRLCAGVVFALDQLSHQGHTCCSKESLLKAAQRLLDADAAALEAGLNTAVQENKIVMDIFNAPQPTAMFFPRRLYAAEHELARAIRVLLNNPTRTLRLPRTQLGQGFMRLNQAQRQAVENAFSYGFSIITGGPGVGKTTVVSQIVAGAKLLRKRVLLAAPTGRAAKRLNEASGYEASTIHRLLKWDAQEHRFVHGPDKPLSGDVLVVDEASMLDTLLASNLFQAVAPGTHVVLVGDKDQLPSVGPGAVLHDLIHCARMPVTYLTEIYRQQDGSRIISNAHAVNQGQLPELRAAPQNSRSDFYWVEQDDPAQVAAMISRLVVERIPQVFGYDPCSEVQILSPMRKGECGTIALNASLQQALNPPARNKSSFQYGNKLFRTGDKVMQTSNNYDKGVFNGEMGQIILVDNEAKKFTVQFDVGVLEYQQQEADQLLLAYAVTVHKSQGSEFPVVIMPLLSQHYVMLQRNLLYTGMTRAKKLLILIGTRRALSIAIHNNAPMQRQTMLIARLQS